MKVVNTITMLTGTVMTSLGLLSMYLNSNSVNILKPLLLAIYESQGVLLLTGIALTLSSFTVMRNLNR